MFLLSLFGVFATASADKFEHSPSAPILNLAETNEFFPIIPFDSIDEDAEAMNYGYIIDFSTDIEYTMPTDRYLSLYIIRERTEFRAVDVDFQVTDGNCDALGFYYREGGDSQVLEGEEETPGFPFIERDADGVHLMYQLNDMPPELYGREVMLYIPSECTLRIIHVLVMEGLIEGATEDTLQGTERTFTTDASADVNQDLIDLLPEDVARIIQDHALHLFKFEHSPNARILNLTETNDYFSIIPFDSIDEDAESTNYAYIIDFSTDIEYTMPMNRYLSLYIIRERTEFRSLNVDFQVTGGNCDALGFYYYEGRDSQVLEGEEDTPGFPLIERDENGIINLMYQLNDMPPELYGREVMLYIPSECTLRINHVIVTEGLIEGATDDSLQGTERTFTTE